jgi:hypothetical protein
MVFVIVAIINFVVKPENIHRFREATIENLLTATQNGE